MSNLERLDEAHSIMVTISSEGGVADVLQTLASVLSCIHELDKPGNDPQFWQQAILNLNLLAEQLQEQDNDDEDWKFEDLTPLDDYANHTYDDDENY